MLASKFYPRKVVVAIGNATLTPRGLCHLCCCFDTAVRDRESHSRTLRRKIPTLSASCVGHTAHSDMYLVGPNALDRGFISDT